MDRITHLCANNDVNGNPRRLYALSEEGNQDFIAVWDEGYYGSDAVPGELRRAAYESKRVDISVRLYNKLLRTVPSPKYMHEVKGYSHLLNA